MRTRGAPARGTPTTGTRTAGSPTVGRRTRGTATRGTATRGIATPGTAIPGARTIRGHLIMATTTFIPQPVKRLVVAITAAGTLVLAPQVPAVAHWSIRDALSWMTLALLIALLEQFPIHVRFKTETFNMSMTDAVWTAGLLIVSPSVLLFAVAAGGTAGQLLRRRQPHKAAFNVGQ